jgi:WXXGXW repeat (2 copies)
MHFSRTLRHMSLPVTVALVAACAASPPPGRVYVVDHPPPPRYELVPIAPTPHDVWVPGRWARAGSDWAWAPGRYVLPPPRYRAWAPGGWHRGKHGWYYVEGHWR